MRWMANIVRQISAVNLGRTDDKDSQKKTLFNSLIPHRDPPFTRIDADGDSKLEMALIRELMTFHT